MQVVSNADAEVVVSRWHLGWCRDRYLPQNRGFSSFLGTLHAGTDHYDYTEDFNDETVFSLFLAENSGDTLREYTEGVDTYSEVQAVIFFILPRPSWSYICCGCFACFACY